MRSKHLTNYMSIRLDELSPKQLGLSELLRHTKDVIALSRFLEEREGIEDPTMMTQRRVTPPDRTEQGSPCIEKGEHQTHLWRRKGGTQKRSGLPWPEPSVAWHLPNPRSIELKTKG